MMRSTYIPTDHMTRGQYATLRFRNVWARRVYRFRRVWAGRIMSHAIVGYVFLLVGIGMAAALSASRHFGF